MKTNHTRLPRSPSITFENHTIIVDNHAFTHPIVFDEAWHLDELESSCTPTTWLDHPLRKPCHQILSWDLAQPTFKILDLYWDNGVSLDILPIDAACRQAKSIDSEQIAFQFILFPNAFT